MVGEGVNIVLIVFVSIFIFFLELSVLYLIWLLYGFFTVRFARVRPARLRIRIILVEPLVAYIQFGN